MKNNTTYFLISTTIDMNHKINISIAWSVIILLVVLKSSVLAHQDVPFDDEKNKVLLITDFKNNCEYCGKDIFQELGKNTLLSELLSKNKFLAQPLNILTTEMIEYTGELFYSSQKDIKKILAVGRLPEKTKQYQIEYILFVDYSYFEKGDKYFLSTYLVSVREQVLISSQEISFYFKEFDAAVRNLSSYIIEKIYGIKIHEE